jgi:hypothetical protein
LRDAYDLLRLYRTPMTGGYVHPGTGRERGTRSPMGRGGGAVTVKPALRRTLDFRDVRVVKIIARHTY